MAKNQTWKRNLKKALLVLGTAIMLLVIFNYKLLYYGAVQLKGQLKLVYHAKDVGTFLEDPLFPDSLKVQLKLVEEIKNFTVSELGFEPSNNYSTMYDQQGQPLMWVVSGASPYSLSPYLWHFPFLGDVPYKGFFDIEMAKEEVELLKTQGLDYSVRNPSAWSTLGYLPEPLLSEMLNNNPGQLADVIIHELTHTMIFVKDSVEFNENLASFVAYHGTIKFLEKKYGPNSQELLEYKGEEADFDKFSDHFLQGSVYLDSIYKDMAQTNPNDSLNSHLKKEAIASIVGSLDTIQFQNKTRFNQLFSNGYPNNTYFMSFLTYRSKFEMFNHLFAEEFDSDLNQFIHYYIQHYPSL